MWQPLAQPQEVDTELAGGHSAWGCFHLGLGWPWVSSGARQASAWQGDSTPGVLAHFIFQSKQAFSKGSL